ncbi:MAG: hypothetical protein NVV74_17270 [Magnetospirillum sp.]|nr:hypothetical protein [Magnetospirillum sp.]
MTAVALSVPERLRRVRGLLDGLHAPTERSFLAYGEVLSRAVAVLQEAGGGMAGLSARLDGSESRDAARQLDDAVRRVVALGADSNGSEGVLGALGGKTEMVARQVEGLRKTVGEVALLSMNGKIQASYLSHSGNDFSVFTVEIARLGELALATIDQTAARLVQLRKSIQDAQGETVAFERRNGEELAAVRLRLQQGLRILGERREGAAHSATEVARRSSDVAAQIAAAIGGMQINDIASQRIAHVSTALSILVELLDGRAETGHGEYSWLAGLEPGRVRVLAGTVLRLQAVQLSRTGEEFAGRVTQLAIHMRALAQDAERVSTLAVEAFAASQSGSASFVGELGREMASARDLLAQSEASRGTLRRLMESMADDFASMAVDLKAIQSIDADMRVMGLNATLKCGRLGGQGMALGVVAHELRACSRRTEEQARRLSQALAESMDMAGTLAGAADAELDRASRAACQAMEGFAAGAGCPGGRDRRGVLAAARRHRHGGPRTDRHRRRHDHRHRGWQGPCRGGGRNRRLGR